MPATPPQELFADSACFCPVTYDEAYRTMKLALLSGILESLGITMTLSQLMDYGKCFGCLGITPSQQAELALLNLISANISTGGLGGAQVYEGRDPLPPDDPTRAAINYPNGGGTQTQWDTGSQAWV